MAAPGPRSRGALPRPQSRPGKPARALPASLHRLVLATQASTSITGRITNAQGEAVSRVAQEAPQGSRSGEGLLGAEEVFVPLREGAGRPFAHVCVPGPEEQEANVPPPL